MATVDETVSGIGEILDFNSTSDNLSIIVMNFGNAVAIEPGPHPRYINLGWWAPLAIYDVLGTGDEVYAGQARFIEFEATAWQPRDFDTFDWHGIRYHLQPGVQVRFFVP